MFYRALIQKICEEFKRKPDNINNGQITFIDSSTRRPISSHHINYPYK